MEKYTKLEQKIKSIAKEIVLAMLDGITDPVTIFDAHTFGHKSYGICYGCAATNMICKVGNLNPFEELMEELQIPRYRYSSGIVSGFESAIDCLREGDITAYNFLADTEGFALIPEEADLPEIDNDNYQDPEVLKEWYDFANSL